MKTRNWEVFLASFLLSFCSLLYELVYAQILSVTIGGTKSQYLITISLFTSALGLGSLCCNYFFKNIKTENLLFIVEMSLIILGSIGPFFIVWLLQAKAETNLIYGIKILLSYFVIFIIGFLSGFEVPCLLRIIKESHGKVLAWDYFGMLAASILFPFLFLPQLGTAASTLFVANINAIILIWLKPDSKRSFHLLAYLVNFLLFICIFLYRSNLNNLLTSLYLESN
jgi:spermidine synthase